MFKTIQKFFQITSFKALIVALMAVGSTYICSVYGLTANFPLTLIATAVVFPIVFSIAGAYKRRESVLDNYGSIKAHGMSIYFAARDWLEDPDTRALKEIRDGLGRLLTACRNLFMTGLESAPENEKAVYKEFSHLSILIKEHLRKKKLAAGELSRCNQYLNKMMISFENIKHIYQYRTPRTLKAYSNFFIVAVPILYGPYFAESAKEYAWGLGYFMPVLFSFALVGLDNIQQHLENPFDQIGEDDVTINVEKYVARLEL